MSKSYWDTNAVIKLYRQEPGSAYLRQKVIAAKNSVILSNLAIVEFQSVIHRQYRKGIISDIDLNLFQVALAKHIHDKHIVVLKIKALQRSGITHQSARQTTRVPNLRCIASRYGNRTASIEEHIGVYLCRSSTAKLSE